MNRNTYLALVLSLLLLLSSLTNAEENNSDIKYRFDKGEGIQSVCADGTGGCYCLSSRFLYHWDEASGMTTITSDDVDQICGMDIWDGQLYAVTSSHAIFRLENGRFKEIAPGLPDEEPVSGKVCAGNGMIFYSSRDSEDMMHLTAFSLSDGTRKALNAFDTPSLAYHPKKDLLVSFGLEPETETPVILCLDWRSNTFLPPVLISGLSTAYRGWCYDGQTDTYYFANRKETLCGTENGGLVPFSSQSSGILAALGQGKLAMITGPDGFKLRIVKKTATAAGLKIEGFDTMSNAVFTQKTGISIQVQEPTGESVMWDISKAMTTQDDRIDIYGVYFQDGLDTIKNKGFFTDLSSSKILKQAAGEMYPAFSTPICTENDEMAVWPVFAMPLLYVPDREALARYGFQPPATLSELMALVPQILKTDLLEAENRTLFDTLSYTRDSFFRYLVHAELMSSMRRGEPVRFDTDGFRALAAFILTELPENDPAPRSEDGTDEPLFLFSAASNVIRTDMLPPPRLDEKEDDGVFVSVLGLIVNPYSQNKDEALAYLEFLANRRGATDYSLYQSMAEPMETPGYGEQKDQLARQLAALQADTGKTEDEKKPALLSLQSELTALEAGRYIVSPEAIRHYRQISSSFVVPTTSLLTASKRLNNLIDLTVSGNMPLDEFIRQADQHIGLIVRESGDQPDR